MDSIVRRSILRICASPDGVTRDYLLAQFAESERPEVDAAVSALVAEGDLVERDGWLSPGGGR